MATDVPTSAYWTGPGSSGSAALLEGSATSLLPGMPAASVHCVVTSPPYFGLRDYGVTGQLGLEATPEAYVAALRSVFDQVRRVLAPDGTCWLNLGDTRTGKGGSNHSGRRDRAAVLPTERRFGSETGPKQLLGIPWRVALALQSDGWILRNEIVWHKTNAMPESVGDRFSSRHEQLFLLTRSEKYYFDLDAVKEPASNRSSGNKDPKQYASVATGVGDNAGRRFGGNPGSTLHTTEWVTRNPGDVWASATANYRGSHYAVMPTGIAERCVLAGSPPGATVLDPFSGTATTGVAALQTDRRYIGIDLDNRAHDQAIHRLTESSRPTP